ncbi:putative RDD family membrane protein YckC [Humibacillus xanthopallidus]|uniref:Putative RDD family membrane protein YckC n=1 Tax=Humibacillus xanthopallidus TaxID=412689 RepID=A0A543PWV7_9MICO|nr:RDD family protein [Humibacillus xanthopallidus]TQN48536.1 putative RDD family membrane protein YckC [Humibacillus xanthopallidus]
MSQQPSGWYDDPSNPDMLRYWDGVMWTSHTAPKKSPTLPQSSSLPPQASSSDATGAAATQGVPTATTPMPQGSGWQGQAPQAYGQGGQVGQQGQYGQAPQYPGAPATAAWMQTIKTTADGVPLASWGRRLAAWIIDGVILTILSYVLLNAFASDYFTTIENLIDAASRQNQTEIQNIAQDLAGQAFRVGLITWGTITVYCLAFWTTLAQTPGKMAVGISVRRVDRPGPLDIGSALRRRLISVLQIVPLVSGLYFIVFLLDYLWPLWDDKRQALHDKVGRTQVVMGKQPRGQA